MIKAVLARKEVVFERTHNIAYLLELLDSASIDKPAGAGDLPNLSPWTAELRYPADPPRLPGQREAERPLRCRFGQR